MGCVVVTDGKYRSALTAVRTFGKAGYRVIVTQTRQDAAKEPPVFSSRWAEPRWIEGSCQDPDYADRLLALLKTLEHPVLFCVGAATLNLVAREQDRFAPVCSFLVASPAVLDALNDKAAVHRRALELSLPVPEQYTEQPPRFPVVVKPHCGERLGLKAGDRYAVAHDAAELERILVRMRQYDPEPLIQELIQGDGSGASLLLDQNSRLIGAICHRRIREYPCSGGPSTCCVSEYDAGRIQAAYRLLSSFGFVGLAMVEFKGDRILEVNPRIWGSFPLTGLTGSPLCVNYARAASGESLQYVHRDYAVGVKLRFFWNDLAATLDCFRHGRFRQGFAGIGDFFRCREALNDPQDRKAYRRYLYSYLPFS